MDALTQGSLVRRTSERYSLRSVAFFHLLIAFIAFVPFILKDGGILTMVADWNRQQIPFNIYANHAIKTGQTAWSHASDLGTNFIGAFSFYNLGSPFFWLSLIFPPMAFPYLIGPIYMLKFMVAGLTSFAYLRRFTQTDRAALLGSLLYTWSGFQISSMSFNHFQDVVAFFPLILLNMERLVMERKRGLFALSLALAAVVNYFFFIGQVVFAVLYFIFRFILGSDLQRLEKQRGFVRCLVEGVIGVALAAGLFLPSVLFVFTNPRSSHSILSQDWSQMLFYADPRKYLMILRAFLFPSDPMNEQSVIYMTNYYSVGIWLPLVGVVPLTIQIFRKRNWLTGLLILSLVMAMVPVLNASFLGFNNAYYARWYFMPILLAALASARILEQTEGRGLDGIVLDGRRLSLKHPALLLPATLTVALALFFFVGVQGDGEGLIYHFVPWLFVLGLALLGLAVTYGLMLFYSGAELLRKLTVALIPVIVLHAWVNVGRMQNIYPYDRPQDAQDLIYFAAREVAEDLPGEDSMDRIYHRSVNWNQSFMLDRPTASSFQSTISGQIFDFYESLGIARYVYTQLPQEADALLDFLSVRYRMEQEPLVGQEPLIEVATESGTVYVYEVSAERYLPMGFTMDQWMPLEQFTELTQEERMELLVLTVVLSEEERDALQDAGYSGYLAELQADEALLRLEEREQVVEAKRLSTPVELTRTATGLEAIYERVEPGLAYYTIPADRGWTATVNGEDVTLLTANGFLLVLLPEGRSELILHYEVPGQRAGMLLSGGGVLGLLLWCWPLAKQKLSQRRELS